LDSLEEVMPFNRFVTAHQLAPACVLWRGGTHRVQKQVEIDWFPRSEGGRKRKEKNLRCGSIVMPELSNPSTI
jgi:hypothetical protein